MGVGEGGGAGVSVAGGNGTNVGVGVGVGVAVAAGVAVAVGVGADVAVALGKALTTTRFTVDCTLPAVIFTVWSPTVSTGTATSTEKLPPASTKGAGTGRTDIPPKVITVMGV